MITKVELIKRLKSLSKTDDLQLKEHSMNTYESNDSSSTYEYLMSLSAEDFVEASYILLLNRNVDQDGKRYYLSALKTGKLSREDILARIKYSPEGIKKKAKLDEINLFHLLLQIPILSYLLRILIFLFNPSYFYRKINTLNYITQENKYLLSNHDRCIKSIETSMSNLSSSLNHAQNGLTNFENDLANTKNSIVGLENDLANTKNSISSIQNELISTNTKLINLTNEVKSLHENYLSDEKVYKSLLDEIHLIKRTLLDIDRRLNDIIVKKHKIKTTFIRRNLPDTNNLYLKFEDKFRGTREEIKKKLKIYLKYVYNYQSPKCLDLGCGRGEWLELLKEKGIDAIGVDVNPILKFYANEYELNIKIDDAFNFLNELPSESYHVITAFHLIEHLPFNLQVFLLDEIYRVLIHNGTAIIETPNPRNILVTASDFYRDPDHLRPVFPDTLQLIAKERGFTESTCFFIQDNNLIPIDEYAFHTLDDYIKVSMDFVWIGKK